LLNSLKIGEVQVNLLTIQKIGSIVSYGTQTRCNGGRTYQKAIQMSHPLITMIITLFFYRLAPPLTRKNQMLRILLSQRNQTQHMRTSKAMEILKWLKSFSIMAMLAQDHLPTTIGKVNKQDLTNCQTKTYMRRKHHPDIRFHSQLRKRKLAMCN